MNRAKSFLTGRAVIGSLALALALGVLGVLPAPAAALDASTLTRLDGSALEADDLPQDAILIFFATWSPRCRGIVARAARIEKEWGSKAAVYLVNFQEDRKAVESFLNGKAGDLRVLLDPEGSFSKKHSITYLPSMLAIKDGAAAFRGKLPADPASVLGPAYD